MLHTLDSDSSKIIEAVRSTGVVITEAMIMYVEYIVSNMKAIGTWDLCNAVYGFVGGTADSHKWNWKDLRDVDSAFRLSYGNTVTHSANGIITDGTVNGFAETYTSPSVILNGNNTHLSCYVKSNNTLGYLIGSIDGKLALAHRTNGIGVFQSSSDNISDRILTTGQSSIIGFNIGVKNNLSLFQQRNGINLAITATNNLGDNSLSTPTIWIGGAKSIAGQSNFMAANTFAFSSIGSSFTDTQAEQQNQIVRNAQNILNRA